MKENFTTGRSIDPFNPFGNEMENSAWNQDYTEIQPKIRKRGYKFSLYADKIESITLLHFYDIAGAMLLIFSLISQFFPAVLETVVYQIIKMIDSAGGVDVTTADYYSKVMNYIESGSSIGMSILMLVHMIFNPLIAIWGLKLIHSSTKELFLPSDFKVRDILEYILCGLSLQMMTSDVAGTVTNFFEKNNVDLVSADLVIDAGAKSIVIDCIYVCLIAPVTEELVFRGFALKAFSRVSQRFAIFMSAFAFGLVHANVSQFITAFIFGIFVAQIDIKHNSIIPSIIVHFACNTVAQIINYSDLFGMPQIVNYIITIVIIIIGLLGLIHFYGKNKIPYNTLEQSTRSTLLARRAPILDLFVLFGIIYIISTNIANNS